MDPCNDKLSCHIRQVEEATLPTFDAYLDAVRKIRKLSDIAAIVGLWWCAARSCKTKAE